MSLTVKYCGKFWHISVKIIRKNHLKKYNFEIKMEEEPNKSTADVEKQSTDVEKQATQHPVIQSINILVHSVIKAQKNGIYSLQEATEIVKSINVLQEHFGKPKEDEQENVE
tara:strand:- start:355 stop:690 length:336 start_codon:yes stop_codon:yes gene_type:complete